MVKVRGETAKGATIICKKGNLTCRGGEGAIFNVNFARGGLVNPFPGVLEGEYALLGQGASKIPVIGDVEKPAPKRKEVEALKRPSKK